MTGFDVLLIYELTVKTCLFEVFHPELLQHTNKYRVIEKDGRDLKPL